MIDRPYLCALAAAWVPSWIMAQAVAEDERVAREQLLARLGITPESLQPKIDRAPLTAADFPGCTQPRWRKRARR